MKSLFFMYTLIMTKKSSTIILFGFSGSGKSTMADMLGKKLGLRVVHPSSILRELLQGKPANVKASKAGKGFWESSTGIKLFKNRLKDKRPIDLICDQILLKEINKGRLIMDSWTMPWLAKKGVKIYLKASASERAKRVSKRSKISLAKAKQTITMKDEGTRKMYQKHGKFNIKTDHQVFDLILDTTKLSKRQVFDHLIKFLS